MNWIKTITCRLGFCLEPNWEQDFPKDRIKEILMSNPAVGGESDIASDIFESGELVSFKYGTKIIEQGAQDDDVYFFLFGEAYIIVKKEKRAIRQAPHQIGEMTALDPSKSRSATVQVSSDYVIALKVSGEDFRAIKDKYPEFLSRLQKDLTDRHREQLLASRIAQENNSGRWFFLSAGASIFTSIVSWVLLEKSGWNLDTKLLISLGVFISSFLLMMLNNPVFFWRRAFSVTLISSLGYITINHYLKLDFDSNLNIVGFNYSLNEKSCDWLQNLGSATPLLLILLITAFMDIYQNKK